MTEEEALEATEAFARDVARRAMDGLREVYSGRELCKHANPVACFAAIHSGLAAALMLGYDVGRAQALAERRATVDEYIFEVRDGRGPEERRERVVRCRDCENYHDNTLSGRPICAKFLEAVGYSHSGYARVSPNGFCAWGEERDHD